MADENNKISIVDGEGTWYQVTVVQSTDDPTKNWLVVCNPDGSSI